MTEFAALEAATKTFFDKHWCVEELAPPVPTWNVWQEFLFGPVPNHELGGCYALFANGELCYVGQGASKGGGLYPDSGISRRLMSHVLLSDRKRGKHWSRLTEKWSTVTAIYTIGFPSDVVYLAAALEGYLIRELSPPRNARV